MPVILTMQKSMVPFCTTVDAAFDIDGTIIGEVSSVETVQTLSCFRHNDFSYFWRLVQKIPTFGQSMKFGTEWTLICKKICEIRFKNLKLFTERLKIVAEFNNRAFSYWKFKLPTRKGWDSPRLKIYFHCTIEHLNLKKFVSKKKRFSIRST